MCSAGSAAPTTLLFLQFARICVLNILSYLRNYWANRPECQRVALSRLGCADYTVVSSICKNKCFKILSYLRNYWAIDPSVNALCSAGPTAPTTLFFFNLQEYVFETFCHISEIIGPIDLTVNALCSAYWAAPTTLLLRQFARIRF